jgi:hypothetical protein
MEGCPPRSLEQEEQAPVLSWAAWLASNPGLGYIERSYWYHELTKQLESDGRQLRSSYQPELILNVWGSEALKGYFAFTAESLEEPNKDFVIKLATRVR